MLEFIVFLSIGIVFVILGFVFTQGKLLFLVAGYNTLPEDEKSKIDKKKLGKYVGIYLILLGILSAITGVLILNFIDFTETIGIYFAIITIISAFALIIVVNKGNRITKK